MRLFLYLIHSNFWIALAAPALIGVTCYEQGLPYPSHLGIAAFFLVLLSYTLQRWVRLNDAAGPDRSAPTSFFSQRTYRILLLIGGGGAAVSLSGLKFLTLYALLPLGLISLFYALPLFGAGKGLRDLPYLKVFLIALSWAYLTVGVPAPECGFWMEASEWLLFTERTLFVLAITIPFDIRDLPYDDPSKRTFPQVIGVRSAKVLSIFLLILFLASSALRLLASENGLSLMLGYTTTAALAAYLIGRTGPGKAPLLYGGYLDGTMLFMFLAVSVFELLL